VALAYEEFALADAVVFGDAAGGYGCE